MMPKISIQPLAELFRANVLAMLKKEGLIDDDFISMIMKWRHTSGFSVDNSVCIARDDAIGITNLAQYIIRSPFSTGKNKKNFSICTAEEFIAAITQHIPNPSFQMVRYVGWYSNRMREIEKSRSLKRKKQKHPMMISRL